MPSLTQFQGCLLGTAVADALGNPVEGYPPDEIKYRYERLIDYVENRDPKGTYTDDTEMSILVAESLLANNGCDADDLGARFADWISWAHSFGKALLESCSRLRQGVPPTESGSKSAGNGAAMRAGPIGLFYHHPDQRKELLECARVSSRITHADPRSVAGAAAVAAGVAYCLHYADNFDPKLFLDDIADAGNEFSPSMADKLRGVYKFRHSNVAETSRALGTGGFVMESVPFAIWCFLTNTGSFEEAVITAVNAGGDTDSNAAMTGAIAGALHGLDAIPKHWIDNLAHPTRGRDYLQELGEKLFNASA